MVVGGFRRPEGTGFLGKRLEGLLTWNLPPLSLVPRHPEFDSHGEKNPILRLLGGSSQLVL